MNLKGYESKIVKEFDWISECELAGFDSHASYYEAKDGEGRSVALKITKDDSGFSDDYELWYSYGGDWEFADVI